MGSSGKEVEKQKEKAGKEEKPKEKEKAGEESEEEDKTPSPLNPRPTKGATLSILESIAELRPVYILHDKNSELFWAAVLKDLKVGFSSFYCSIFY